MSRFGLALVVLALAATPLTWSAKRAWAEFRGELGAAADGEALIALWVEGERLEHAGRLVESARRYERVARALPAHADPQWRIARNYWRAGERLPIGDKQGRLHYFDLAAKAAKRGLELDPDCAACMLWRAASLGRLGTTRGTVSAARQAAPIAELLERGIALQPTYRDNDRNTTLGNLYHASAAFYRLVPDWFWLKWVIGVRGDKRRSVEYSRKAVALSPSRLDYQVELGAGLLCLGTAELSSEHLAEGREVLKRSTSLTPFLATDGIDMLYARILIDQPERACSYARDGWIDLKEGLGSTDG